MIQLTTIGTCQKHKRGLMTEKLLIRNLKRLHRIGLNLNQNTKQYSAKKNLIGTIIKNYAFATMCGALT